MNNHQEKGDVLDPSSTKMFGNSSENVVTKSIVTLE